MRTIKSFFQIMLSGLILAITINYLLTGFIDIVFNINSVLIWFHKSGMTTYKYRCKINCTLGT